MEAKTQEHTLGLQSDRNEGKKLEISLEACHTITIIITTSSYNSSSNMTKHEGLNTYQNVELDTEAEELGGSPEPDQQNPHQESTDQDPNGHSWKIQVN